jgi:hypothetical protein
VNRNIVNYFKNSFFNNISAMSLGKVLLVPPMVEETGGFGGKPKKLEQQMALNTIKKTNKHIIPNLPLLYFPTFPS